MEDSIQIDPELDETKKSDKLQICDDGYGIKINPLNNLDNSYYLVQGKHKICKLADNNSRFQFSVNNKDGDLQSMVGIGKKIEDFNAKNLFIDKNVFLLYFVSGNIWVEG